MLFLKYLCNKYLLSAYHMLDPPRHCAFRNEYKRDLFTQQVMIIYIPMLMTSSRYFGRSLEDHRIGIMMVTLLLQNCLLFRCSLGNYSESY